MEDPHRLEASLKVRPTVVGFSSGRPGICMYIPEPEGQEPWTIVSSFSHGFDCEVVARDELHVLVVNTL